MTKKRTTQNPYLEKRVEEITLRELVGARPYLDQLLAIRLEAAAALAIGRAARPALQEFITFDEKRNELIAQFGSKDEKTGQIGLNPKDPKFSKYSDEIKAVLEQIVPLELIPIDADWLAQVEMWVSFGPDGAEKKEPFRIDSRTMAVLWWLIP